MRFCILAMGLASTLISHPLFAGVWLCKVDAATGLIRQGDQLISSPYRSARTHIVRPWREGDDLTSGHVPEPDTYILHELGDPRLLAWTSRPMPPDHQVINLNAGFVEAKINTLNGSFVLVSTVGYMVDGKNAENMPYFEVGRCSRLE